MPATQKTQASITTGETLTAKAFAADDLTTVVQTASSVTEITDDDSSTPTGIYEATFTDLPADDYTVNYYIGGTKVADYDYRITLTDATFKPVDLALLTALGNVPTPAEIREEMDSNSTQLAVAAAGAAGSVAVTDNENGTLTLSFKGADGTTEVANVTYTTETGARTRNS
jgi:hypothetical protein